MRSPPIARFTRTHPWVTDAASFLISALVHGVALFVLALIPLFSLTDEVSLALVAYEVVEEEQAYIVDEPPSYTMKVEDARFEELLNSHQRTPVRGSLSSGVTNVALADLNNYLHPAARRAPADKHSQYFRMLRPVPINRKPQAAGAETPDPDSVDLESDPYIAVVARFIRYDIGELRGEEGDRAHREFHSLGEDAIPALVWGLNQSAYLNQSCPVIVIQSKLNEELTASSDPQHIPYVLANVGKGVPPNAPYASRLRSFRQRLAGGDDTTAAAAAQQQRQIRAQLVRRLARSPRTIRERLSDEDPNVRWAAARLTASRGLPFVNELAALLDDEDADVRHEAHEALMRISRGEDYGPANDLNEDDRRASIDRWREWWQFAQSERRESLNRHRVTETPEEAAENLLQTAIAFETEGQMDAAARNFRRIIDRFPTTPAAKIARERLAQ